MASIEDIRKTLQNLEDTIIRGLCERSNYKQNLEAYVYKSDIFQYNDKYTGSYFDYLFKKTECVQSIVGRYDCFYEKSYYKGNPVSLVKRNYNAKISEHIINFSDKINLNPHIKIFYLNFLNELCNEGDDVNYGDSVTSDIFNLQAISKRIHYGILVMESKYTNNKEKYDQYIKVNDDIGILKLLKNTVIEEKVLERIDIKSQKYGIKNPKIVVNFFRNFIIPMTINVELEYLFGRHST